MNPVTPEFLATLRGPHRIAVEVDVGQFGQTIVSNLPVVDGSVTLDAGAATYAQCEITTLYPGRFPIDSGQFGMELVIRRGIVGHRDLPELVPLGVFKIVAFDLDGNNGQLRLSGMDRSKYALDARLEDDVTVDAATPVLDVIATLIATAVPHAPRELPTGSYTVPEVVFETKTPPWEAVQQLAAAIGKQPRFDGLGTFRLVDVNAPIGTPVWTIDEGANGVLVSASTSGTDDQIFNRIIAASPPDDAGVVYRGVATDTTSSARYGGPYGRKPEWIESDLFTSDEMAQEAARARLESVLGASRSVSFSAVPNCALVPGDIILLRNALLGLDAKHVVEKVDDRVDRGSGDVRHDEGGVVRRRDLERAFNDLARAVTAGSVVTAAPATSTVRAVVVTVTPLTARVGIAETATPVTNSIPGYSPVVDDVVVVARVGRRQFITGKT